MRGNSLRTVLAVTIAWAATTQVGHASHKIIKVDNSADLDMITAKQISAVGEKTGMVRIGDPGMPDLPWRIALVPELVARSAGLTLNVIKADTVRLREPISPIQPDMITSDTASIPLAVAPDASVYGRDAWYPSVGVRHLTTGGAGERRVSGLAWSPYRYNPVRGELIVIREAAIAIDPSVDESSSSDTVVAVSSISSLIPPDRIGRQGRRDGLPLSSGSTPSWVLPDDPALGVEYVVVTAEALFNAVKPLVRWKASRGINAGIATVERIAERYPGVDAAASVREYLKAAYETGLAWVVMAGDETVLPTRLAYAGYKSDPTDPAEFQLSDLYFAELDGDWDADGDGIYGEYFGDAAEIYRELYIGRLPFSDACEAAVVIDKIINYERGPADGSYLTRALSVSADQMRDWGEGTGQHAIVAAAMPSGWTHDGQSMVESPSGSSTAPVAPDGPTLPAMIAEGFGYVNYYVHGRADGIVVRASGYSDWPKSYVWTFGNDGDGHGHLNQMQSTPYPGIHLSVGCNHGGFDMNSPPFAPGFQESVAERLLFTPEGGAVAFVGQSRWGWVSSSYRIIEEFYRLMGDESVPNHVGIYQALAVESFPNYRDLNYGNNLYGDPEMAAWKDVPREMSIEAPLTFSPGSSVWSIRATEAASAISGALAMLNVGDTVWNLGMTDGGGELTARVNLDGIAEVVLTVSKPAYRIFVDTVPQSIITGVWDDGDDLPRDYATLANYPNPFNPSTQLEFSLDVGGEVELTVFDILGRKIATLVDGYREAGWHRATFDGHDDSGRSLASGIYLARLRAGERTDVRKMVLLR